MKYNFDAETVNIRIQVLKRGRTDRLSGEKTFGGGQA